MQGLIFGREREAAEHEKALHALLEDEQRERQRELDAKQYQCVICDEEYPLDDMYTVDDCFHKFCFEVQEICRIPELPLASFSFQKLKSHVDAVHGGILDLEDHRWRNTQYRVPWVSLRAHPDVQ